MNEAENAGAQGMTDSTADLAAQELWDRLQLSELIAKLGRWLDDHDFDDVDSLFTRDVVADTPGGVAQGVEAVAVQARRGHSTQRCQHFITQLHTELKGDEASVEADFIVVFAALSPAERTRFMGARYHFESRRTDSSWLLSRVAITPVWHR